MNRKWFQIHLSTMLIVTFAAALLLWKEINTRENEPGSFSSFAYYGWPWPAVLLNQTIWPPRLSIPRFIGNVAICVGILAALAFHCELYHKLQKSKPNSASKSNLLDVRTAVLIFVSLFMIACLNIVGHPLQYWYTKSEEFIGHTVGFPIECGHSGFLKHFSNGNTRDFFELNYDTAMLDVLIGIAALLFVGVVSETFFRRREARAE
jgi:hypothetical protein